MNIKLSFWQTYSKPTSKRALEAFKTLKEVVKAVPEGDALLILEELESQVRAAMRFDEDVYKLLPWGLSLRNQRRSRKKGKGAKLSSRKLAARSKCPFLKRDENDRAEQRLR
ncbi:hypothetical protein MUP01_02350 [Candidatus Bathyarchaeota archaeon]|nr:hypothetical protein [Candidatus Bathyarchaeota archaeon]